MAHSGFYRPEDFQPFESVARSIALQVEAAGSLPDIALAHAQRLLQDLTLKRRS